MSSLVYPTLKGLTYTGGRTMLWKTEVQPALSDKESAIALQQYPSFKWELNYEILDHSLVTSELKTLWGLVGAMRGMYDTFLYTDPLYNTVVDEPFGTGDGTTTAFQIVATFQNSGGPGVAELIQNFNGAVVVKKAGVTQTGGGTNYTLGATGIVTFNTAPAAAAALTWSGSFYYRCRMLSDAISFSEFMANWWETRQIAFKTRFL